MKYMLFYIIFSLFFLSAYGQDESRFLVRHLPFNTFKYDEFSAFPFREGLVFCSNRSESKMISFRTAKKRSVLFDLFYVSMDDSVNWQEPVPLDNLINTAYHEGPGCYAKEKEILFFTRNLGRPLKIGNATRDKNSLGIFMAQMEGDQVVDVYPFPHNNPDYNTAFPAWDESGKTLYFSSDRKGGEGRMDLYSSRLVDGEWTQPENLGPIINSDRDEVYPVWNHDQKLYFSIDGADKGVGRLDIFYSEKVNGKWIEPDILGQPINSRYDDFGYVLHNSEHEGYFTSGRKGSDDIYAFSEEQFSFTDCDSIREKNYCITVYEEGTMDMDESSYQYEWDMGDGTAIRGKEAHHCYQDTGTYVIQLNVIDSLTGDVYFNEATYEYKLGETEQVYIHSSDTGIVHQPMIFSSKGTYFDQSEIKRYYWRFEDGEFAFTKKNRHIFAKPGKYRVWLGVKGVNQKNGKPFKSCSFKDIVILDGD